MLKRYRWTILIGVLFVGWLVFGQNVITRLLEGTNTAIYEAEAGLPGGLSGRLIYTQGVDGIWQFDLQSGERTVLWETPHHDYVQGIALSPDGTQAVVTYAPTLEAEALESSTDLYITDMARIDLQPLIERDNITTHFSHPVWTADGIYFSHFRFAPEHDTEFTTGYIQTIDHFTVAQPTLAPYLENAVEVHIAPEGILYVYFDPQTFVMSLWQMAHDGTNARQIMDGAAFEGLSSPRFYNETVIFSGSGGPYEQVSANVAQAHGAAWDVWELDANGNPRPFTELSLDGPFIALSPDGSQFAFLALEGVYLYTGETLYRIAESTAEGEIVWIP